MTINITRQGNVKDNRDQNIPSPTWNNDTTLTHTMGRAHMQVETRGTLMRQMTTGDDKTRRLDNGTKRTGLTLMTKTKEH